MKKNLNSADIDPFSMPVDKEEAESNEKNNQTVYNTRRISSDGDGHILTSSDNAQSPN